jgi:hypothetical protein
MKILLMTAMAIQMTSTMAVAAAPLVTLSETRLMAGNGVGLVPRLKN